MLREIEKVRQVPNDYFRRWFADEDFDLYVWHKADGTFYGFQLCYDIADDAKAFTWVEDRGFSHQSIDTGEESPLANRTPVLGPSSHFDGDEVMARFGASSRNLPAPIRDLVLSRYEAYKSKS